MGDSFVFATSSSVFALLSAFSALDMRSGVLPYMPSWNFWPLPVDASLDMVPHDVTMQNAASISSVLIFIVILLIY